MNNIVKIGTAIKWRGVFDKNTKYYLENIVSLCGSVFRCKVPVTQGKSPIEVIDNVGRIAYANSDIWDVVVDFVDYYNGRIDNEILLTEDRKQILINAINIQKNKNEIDKIKGNSYYLDFESSEGWQFFRGRVDTKITVSIIYAFQDITKELVDDPEVLAVWSRDSDNAPADNLWKPRFIDDKWNVLHLTNGDMPSGWGITVRKVKFTCKIFVPENPEPIVENDFGFKI